MREPYADLKDRYEPTRYPVPWPQAIRDMERVIADNAALELAIGQMDGDLRLRDGTIAALEQRVERLEDALDNARNAVGRADALLAVVEYVKQNAPFLWAVLESLGLTAALPEHLKGESDE